MKTTSDEKSRAFCELQKYLSGLPNGLIDDTKHVERLLVECWHEFDGSGEAGMDGHKVLHRTEKMRWNPPYLTFDMERHGDIVFGSVYAQVQSWILDCDQKTAKVESTGRRQVRAKDRVVKTKPIAEAVAKLILDRESDPRLIWKTERKVRIDIEKVIPAKNKQTTSSRRRRFRADLGEVLKPRGWRMTTINTFERD